MKILCIGQEWRGSNSSGLFYALSAIGHIIDVVNDLRYVSTKSLSFATKFANRLVRGFQVADFNKQLIKETDLFQPDLIFIYKGTFLQSSTINFWKKKGIKVVLFFPDISFLNHTKYIRENVMLYDHIFSTKTFFAKDVHRHFKYPVNQISFIPHGFDPFLHKPLTQQTDNNFTCEASFIGKHTSFKQTFLEKVIERLPNLKLSVWGGGEWNNVTGNLKKFVKSGGIFGDAYTLAINQSLINIALLQNVTGGASSGDLITSRTFHIPASGGFMLHQKTAEIGEYFVIGKEIDCFETPEELADKIKFYLDHSDKRERIRIAGYQRAVKDHSLNKRAEKIMQIVTEKVLHAK